MIYMPDDNRDVIVALPDGSQAYGYYSEIRGWQVYPNTYPVSSSMEFNSFDCVEHLEVIDWREIQPMIDYSIKDAVY